VRVNFNHPSFIAYNATTKLNNQLAKATEKLATGLRINRAADDAAGLAISEKMTAQIRGLDQASRNAQDGMSLLQTAEGALNEIHSMLQRMRELALQAANGTLTDDDRGFIQLEINQLTQQITDIANQTQFNKKKLLNGDASVLWSASTSDVSVLVGGSLLWKDMFGQTKNAEGNYKITFETIQAGSEQVQKSNIMYLKHGTLDVASSIDGASGVTGFNALNMVEGVWQVGTLGSPFGGVQYMHGSAEVTPASNGPQVVGAELDKDAASGLEPGEYDIRLSDNVPMMATFDTQEIDDIYMSSRTNANGADISGLDTFDAIFGATEGASTVASLTNVPIRDIANTSATLTSITSISNSDMNVFTYYEVGDTDARDLVGGVLEVSTDYSAPVGSSMDVTLDYKTEDTSNIEATLNYVADDNIIYVYSTFHFSNSVGNSLLSIKAGGETINFDLNGLTVEQAAAKIAADIAANAAFATVLSGGKITVQSVENPYDHSATFSFLYKTTVGSPADIELTGSALDQLQVHKSGVSYAPGSTITLGNDEIAIGDVSMDLRCITAVDIATGTGATDLERAESALNAALNSKGVTVKLEEVGPSGSGVQQLKFTRTGIGYTIDFGLSDPDKTNSSSYAHNQAANSLASDLGLSASWTLGAYDNITTGTSYSANIYDGYKFTVNTYGLDMSTNSTGLAAALNSAFATESVSGVTASSLQSGFIASERYLSIDNQSKYRITLEGGNTDNTQTNLNAIGELYNNNPIIINRKQDRDSGVVYVNHTFDNIPVSGDYYDIISDLNLYLAGQLPSTGGPFFSPYGDQIRMSNPSFYDISIADGIVPTVWGATSRSIARGGGSVDSLSDTAVFGGAGTVLIHLDGTDDATYDEVTIEDAVSAITNQLANNSISWLSATVDYSDGYGRIVFTTTNPNSQVGIRQTATAGTALLSGTLTLDTDTTTTLYPAVGYSSYIQAKDALDLKVAWEGNRADGSAIAPGSRTVRVYEDYDNAALLNYGLAGTPLANFYQSFVLNGATTGSDFQVRDSWMAFTNAAVTGGDALEVKLTDDQTRIGRGVTTQPDVTYYFDSGVLEAGGVKNINQMAWAGGGRGNQYENLQHHIDFGDIPPSPGSASFAYGERANGGDMDTWAMGGSRSTMPYYAQAYYGEQTTYYIAGGASIDSVVTGVQVNKMNDINASLLFTYEGGGNFKVEYKGYEWDGTPHNGTVTVNAGAVNGGPATIAGIDFDSININTAGLSVGDEFVINVAAAAKLDNPGALESNENLSLHEDLSRSGGVGWDSSMQYRFKNGGLQNSASLTGNYEDYVVNRLTGATPPPTAVLKLGSVALNSDSGVGNANGLGDDKAYWIRAQVNNQGDLVAGASGLVTSAYIQDMKNNALKQLIDYLPKITYGEVKGVLSATTSASGSHNDYNASVIFDFLGFVDDKARFRVQAHVIDINGNYAYMEDEEVDIIIGENANGQQFVLFSGYQSDPDDTWQGTLPGFNGLYFDNFELGGTWTPGDRFTLSLTASGAAGSNTAAKAADPNGIDQTMDEVTFISDLRGTAQPHSFRFNNGALNNGSTDFHIYQLTNNTYLDSGSEHFADDQVMDGTVTVGFGTLADSPAAVMFTSKFMKGIDAGVAHYYSRTEDIKQFWDANGVFMLEDQPEKLTIKLGDKEMDIYIDSQVELGKLARRMSEQIWLNLIQGQGELNDKSIDKDDIDDRDLDEIVQFVNSVPGQSSNEAVFGTFVAHSVIPGANYKLQFIGSEELMKALGFNEIMSARDTVFEMTIVDAHTGRQVASPTRVVAGQNIDNVVAPGISLAANAALGINEVFYDDAAGVFRTNLTAGATVERFIHLADNATVLQIGANQGEDTVLLLGDMTAKSLGIQNLEVRNRDEAARSVTRIDDAIKKVSTQRAIIGAQVNRLEHAVNALTVSSTNLSGARSAIKDTDYASEMMTFTRLNILHQAGLLMQAQANQINRNVLTLMR
jgi:flagellin-like hook-associated protein FlgL